LHFASTKLSSFYFLKKKKNPTVSAKETGTLPKFPRRR
jgi:hypothetical protein